MNNSLLNKLKTCSECQMQIHKDATICLYCDAQLDVESELEPKLDNSGFLTREFKHLISEIWDELLLDLGMWLWFVVPILLIAPIASLIGITTFWHQNPAVFYGYLIGSSLFLISLFLIIYTIILACFKKQKESKALLLAGWLYALSTIIGIWVIFTTLG